MRADRLRRWTRQSRAVALALALPACGPGVVHPVAPSCPAEHAIVLASQDDVARLASCTTARGMAVRSGAALDISKLAVLATITGDLVIGPTVAVEEIIYSELRSVEGTIRVVGNGLLQGLYFPRLERAGRIEIEGNAAVTMISLPRLRAVHGALHIIDNARLELVALSALASIDQDLVLAGDPRLTLIEAPQLQHVAAVRLDVPRLPADVAGRLRAIAAAP